jgi:hypothetical protein
MHSVSELFRRIEDRYAFCFPSEYTAMHRKGWLQFDPARRGLPQPYLWMNEMEWLSLQDMLDFEFPTYCKPGFVPFAFTGGGDHWCWYPEHAADGVTPVVLCPRDSTAGEFYAPSFTGSLYRQILDFACSWIKPAEEAEARTHLKRWLDDLCPFFPAAWRVVVAALHNAPLKQWESGTIVHGLLLPDEHRSIIHRDLVFPRLDEQFEWMDK